MVRYGSGVPLIVVPWFCVPWFCVPWFCVIARSSPNPTCRTECKNQPDHKAEGCAHRQWVDERRRGGSTVDDRRQEQRDDRDDPDREDAACGDQPRGSAGGRCDEERASVLSLCMAPP